VKADNKKPLPEQGLMVLLAELDHLPIFGGSRKAMAKNSVEIARARIRM
jgi:hypothetical protein